VSPAQLRQTLSAAPALPPASVKAIPARIEDPKALVEAPVHRAQEPARPQPVVTEREPAPDELELALPLEPSRISLPETAQTILAALPAAEHAFADRNDAPWIPVTPESETREVGFAVSVPGLQRFATPAVQDFASDFSMPVPPHALFAPTTTPRLIPEPDSALLLGAALTAIAVGRRSLRRP
jgi:hypothetical protein